MAIRSGRIANVEREIVLEELGREAEYRYINNLRRSGYDTQNFENAFHWTPNIEVFDNDYWIDTGSLKLNRILQYLEYGTGLYGSSKKPIRSKVISAKTGRRKLLKFKYLGRQIFTMQVKGIKPIFAFTKAVESIRNERVTLQRHIRIAIGI